MKATIIPATPTVALSEERVSRVRRAVTRLSRRLRQEGSAGITPSQMAVLGSLERTGPLTLGDLAAEEAISAPAISRTVRSLEEEGLVQRETVEDDRRASQVRLTPRAKRVMQAIRGQRNAWLEARMATLSPRQVADLERGIAAIERILEPVDAGDPGPGAGR
jgi:DNA-binding MarR family transcriptional regulator